MREDNLNMKPIIWIGGILSLVNFIVGFLAYPHLPDRIPIHWNFAGEVDGWGSPWQGAFLFPIIILAVSLLMVILPKIDPKKKSYAQMGKAYRMIMLILIGFLSIMYYGTLGAALGYFEGIPTLVPFGVGIVFIIIGNYMGKIKHNYFMGIRTPWTLASEEVWYKTHRLAGPLWVVGGLLFIIMSFLAKAFFMKMLFAIIIVITLVPLAYSYVIFKKIEKS